MPCLDSSMEPGSLTPGRSAAAGADEPLRRDAAAAPQLVRSPGWFFSPLWSPRRSSRFQEGMNSEQVEAWLDDHSDFTRAYFLRRTSV